MEQPGVLAGNLVLSFSLIFLSIYVHISGPIRSITLIQASIERSFPHAEVEYRRSKVMTSEVDERPRLVTADYGGGGGGHRSQWVNNLFLL